jgi:CBS domain-containing protein
VNVGDLCATDVVSIGHIETVSASARMMRERRTWVFRSLCARAPDLLPTGVLTDREIVMAMIAKEGDARALRVVHVMSSGVLLAGNPRSHARRWSPARPCCRTQRSANPGPSRWTTWSEPLQPISQALSEPSATNSGASEQPGLSTACPPA